MCEERAPCQRGRSCNSSSFAPSPESPITVPLPFCGGLDAASLAKQDELDYTRLLTLLSLLPLTHVCVPLAMTIPLGASPTNTAFADKLDQLLVRGTLSDVQQSLHLPTSDAIRLGRQCTTSPLSLMDSSTSYGTVLLGCAALARRSFAFRLACFAIVLEAGANPFARGRDGRAVSWVLDSVKNSAERECFVEELQRAKQAWMSGEKYEIGAFPRSSWPAIVTETVQTAADIQEWIDQTLTLIEEEKREALEQSKRDALVQSPQEMKLAAARERAHHYLLQNPVQD